MWGHHLVAIDWSNDKIEKFYIKKCWFRVCWLYIIYEFVLFYLRHFCSTAPYQNILKLNKMIYRKSNTCSFRTPLWHMCTCFCSAYLCISSIYIFCSFSILSYFYICIHCTSDILFLLCKMYLVYHYNFLISQWYYYNHLLFFAVWHIISFVCFSLFWHYHNHLILTFLSYLSSISSSLKLFFLYSYFQFHLYYRSLCYIILSITYLEI